MKRRCPTCRGAGLVWRSTNTKPRRGLNDDGAPCMAAFRCPTCPDDGTGNSVGTGWVDDDLGEPNGGRLGEALDGDA